MLIESQLIKKLSTTPIIPSQEQANAVQPDPQASLQANKATFFFRLERELEKVNTFYLQKEAEVSPSQILHLVRLLTVEAQTSVTDSIG